MSTKDIQYSCVQRKMSYPENYFNPSTIMTTRRRGEEGENEGKERRGRSGCYREGDGWMQSTATPGRAGIRKEAWDRWMQSRKIEALIVILSSKNLLE
jgi:hypothetical protein